MSCLGAAQRGASVSRSDGARVDRTLPRDSRLRARKLFLEIYERGLRVSGAYFVVFGLPGRTGTSRLGITATKKCGTAVERNRMKRVVREIFRRCRTSSDTPVDMVVNVKAGASGQTYDRLDADLTPRLGELRRKLVR